MYMAVEPNSEPFNWVIANLLGSHYIVINSSVRG